MNESDQEGRRQLEDIAENFGLGENTMKDKRLIVASTIQDNFTREDAAYAVHVDM